MAWFVPFVFKIAPTPHLPHCRKVRSFWSLWRGAWSKKPAMFLSSYRNRAAEAPHTPLQRRSEGLVQGNNIRFFLIGGGGVHGIRFCLGDSVRPDGFQWNAWFIISDWLLTVEHVQSFCWRLLTRIRHQSFVGLPQRHWKNVQLIHFRKALLILGVACEKRCTIQYQWTLVIPRAVGLPANSQQNIHQKAGGPSKSYVSRRPGEVFVLTSFSSLQRSTQLYLCKTSIAVFRDGGAGESSGVECFTRTSTSRGFDTKSGFDSRSTWHRPGSLGNVKKVVEKGLLRWKFLAWHCGVDLRLGMSACVMCNYRTGNQMETFPWPNVLMFFLRDTKKQELCVAICPSMSILCKVRGTMTLPSHSFTVSLN